MHIPVEGSTASFRIIFADVVKSGFMIPAFDDAFHELYATLITYPGAAASALAVSMPAFCIPADASTRLC